VGAVDRRKDLSESQWDLLFALRRRWVAGPVQVAGECELPRDRVARSRLEQGTDVDDKLFHDPIEPIRGRKRVAPELSKARPRAMLQA